MMFQMTKRLHTKRTQKGVHQMRRDTAQREKRAAWVLTAGSLHRRRQQKQDQDPFNLVWPIRQNYWGCRGWWREADPAPVLEGLKIWREMDRQIHTHRHTQAGCQWKAFVTVDIYRSLVLTGYYRVTTSLSLLPQPMRQLLLSKFCRGGNWDLRGQLTSPGRHT